MPAPDTPNDRQALLDAILQRAADRLGDIAPIACARLHERIPEARAAFEAHHPGAAERLEGEMVEQTLYCLMQWIGSPGEIEIVLMGTVPHHADTLNVPPAMFAALLDAVAETIGETIPPDNRQERALWDGIHRELTEIIDQSAQYTRAAQARPH